MGWIGWARVVRGTEVSSLLPLTFLARRCLRSFALDRPATTLCRQARGLSAAAAAGGGSDYDVLGVSPSSTKEEVKKAYRREALKWHPDRHNGPSKAQAEAKFKRISEAYSNISSGKGRVGGYGARGQTQARRERGRAGANYQYQYTYPGSRGGGNFTRGEADKIFEEFFGSGAAQHIFREMENMFRHHHQQQQGRRQGGAFVFRGGMKPEEFRRIFEHQEEMRSQRNSYTDRKRETFVSRSGITMERVTTTTKDSRGRVISRTVEETQVPSGGRTGGGQGGPASRKPSPLVRMISSVFTQVFVRVFVPVMVKTVQRVLTQLFSGKRIK
ncbi:DnaJ-like protein [Chloropicon primus]|uniref:DnaJ-like protein n=1 Tax=Chloropicon primus TaxID=1764295 RepID=A0A5B8MKE5_9CHLO|nr:DnaJ-like protein [Chloropicon primus]UPQ99756.1 DnaJ-like protein [Chloropicon primus]|eukprot:QDZ20544.1 DnaJ-like protein [Chloropicon primus]